MCVAKTFSEPLIILDVTTGEDPARVDAFDPSTLTKSPDVDPSPMPDVDQVNKLQLHHLDSARQKVRPRSLLNTLADQFKSIVIGLLRS